MGAPGHISVAAPVPLLPRDINFTTRSASIMLGRVGLYSLGCYFLAACAWQLWPLDRRRHANHVIESGALWRWFATSKGSSLIRNDMNSIFPYHSRAGFVGVVSRLLVQQFLPVNFRAPFCAASVLGLWPLTSGRALTGSALRAPSVGDIRT